MSNQFKKARTILWYIIRPIIVLVIFIVTLIFSPLIAIFITTNWIKNYWNIITPDEFLQVEPPEEYNQKKGDTTDEGKS